MLNPSMSIQGAIRHANRGTESAEEPSDGDMPRERPMSLAQGVAPLTIVDYVVIGGGSAGCVVTQRLVKAGKSVLMLEAGPPDNHPFIHVPATFVRIIGSRRSFMYRTEPEPGVDGRILAVPQGRTLGGGSSINAMIYIRGQAQDYDAWRELGCTGWSYSDVLPVFRRSEGNQRLAGELHGGDGPLKVTDLRYTHPLSHAFLRAAQEAGYPYNHDFNGVSQEGVGFYQATISNGRRGSTAVTYLKSVRHSPLLTVRTGCEATRIIIEGGVARGVVYRTDAGATHEVRVILTAGAVASPKLLLLSGIGSAVELARHGIPLVKDLPGVGENFQDHISAPVYGVTDQPISLLGEDKGLRAVRNGLQYLFSRSGLLTSNVVESGGFIDTSGEGRPDVQIHVTPALVGDAERKPMGKHGITINPCVLRPTSRGKVSLRSSSPSDTVVLAANNLTTEKDVATLVRGIKACRRILRSESLRALGVTELLPGGGDEVSDEVLARHGRAVAKTVYHPSGTCKMGTDPMAVVDTQLRVVGVPGLRVADASIMPTLVSGNTNAPTVMIAERCADFILSGSPGV